MSEIEPDADAWHSGILTGRMRPITAVRDWQLSGNQHVIIEFRYVQERCSWISKNLGDSSVVAGKIHSEPEDFNFLEAFGKIRDDVLPSANVDGWGDIAPVNLN